MVSLGKSRGFSLIELLIVMSIFGFVIVGSTQMFTSVLRDFKQQSEITMSNIEGIVGLELMRRDVENAGYGLFWDWQGGAAINYTEVPLGSDPAAVALNDNTGTAKPPRALVIGNNTSWNGSDRLAVKALNVSMSEKAEKWNYLKADNTVDPWISPSENPNLETNDRVIVISPEKSGSDDSMVLIPTTTGFSTTFGNVSNFSSKRQSFSFIYVVDPNTNLKMPFNRADFYVGPSAALPSNCAPGTGVLYKAVVSQNLTAAFNTPLVLLDCVADMQVAVLSDDDGNGNAKYYHQGAAADGMDLWDAAKTRRIREVQIFILAQEGMRDRNYTHPDAVMRVGAPMLPAPLTVGRDFDFAANGISDWRFYRWKLFTLVIKPVNLR